MSLPKPRRITWPQSFRIIASRYPPINLFERLGTDSEAVAALIALEQLTNPRVKQEMGQLSLVPDDQIVTGQGAGYVMAAFTHVNPEGSRFSDGTYGVWYAANDLNTALAEHGHHWAVFAGDSNDPAGRRESMRVLTNPVKADLVAVDDFDAETRTTILAADDYRVGQRVGAEVRDADGEGLVWSSIRNKGGDCVGIFRPDRVMLPVSQERHLTYHWDGSRLDSYFDHKTDTWVSF